MYNNRGLAKNIIFTRRYHPGIRHDFVNWYLLHRKICVSIFTFFIMLICIC